VPSKEWSQLRAYTRNSLALHMVAWPSALRSCEWLKSSVSSSDLKRRGAKLTRQLKINEEGHHEDFIFIGDGPWKEREVAKGIGES
jgi:hypothetical protein